MVRKIVATLSVWQSIPAGLRKGSRRIAQLFGGGKGPLRLEFDPM